MLPQISIVSEIITVHILTKGLRFN